MSALSGVPGPSSGAEMGMAVFRAGLNLRNKRHGFLHLCERPPWATGTRHLAVSHCRSGVCRLAQHPSRLPSSPFSRFCSPPKARLPPLPCPPGVLRGSPLNPCGLEQCPAGRRHSVNESLWLLGRAKARSCVRRDNRKRKGGHRRSAVTWRAGMGLSPEDSALGSHSLCKWQRCASE